MELRLKDHKLFEDKPEEFLFVIDLTQKDVKKHRSLSRGHTKIYRPFKASGSIQYRIYIKKPKIYFR